MLASSGQAQLRAGLQGGAGAGARSRESGGRSAMPYVMGDDPERMDADAVIAARPLRRAIIRNDEPVAGYLYLVCHKPRRCPAGRWDALRSSFALAGAGADRRASSR